ncbi:MAG TPA: DUF2157 domain-containing protein [Lacipirellulaceae bacterium]|jgi:uncharacterized membrane protein
MSKWSISTKQRAWLVEQLERWQSQHFVSADQATQVLGLYESPAELAERGRSKLLVTLMGVAAFLIGLALLLLIGYNWQAMPAAIKLLIIFGALAATHALAFELRFRRQMPLGSEVAFLLASLIYGAAIFLVAQIFHLSGHTPDAVWWWAVGVLPFALCLDSVLLHVLLAALLAIWCGMEIIGFDELGAWFFGRWRHVPNGAYSLPLFVLLGLGWAYRRGSVAAIWLYVPLLAWWAILQPFAWQAGELGLFYCGIVAGLLLILADSHVHDSPFARPYREMGVVLALIPVFVLSFYEASKEIFRHDLFRHDTKALFGYATPIVFAVLALALTVFLLYLTDKAPRETSGATSPVVLIGQSARRHWLPVGTVLLMVFFIVCWTERAEPILPTILANVAVIVIGLWLVGQGLDQDSGRTFAAGVICLLTWTVMRYIDLFGDVGGMLGAAAIFFLCGLALFGVAWFWRHRKEVVHG